MTANDVTSSPLPRLPVRPADSHKGDFGRALLIGGSPGMSGAIVLSGLAALRGGAGLVTLAVPQVIQNVVAGFNPCYMTAGLPDDGRRVVAAAAEEVLASASSITAAAVGPGIGRGAEVTRFVRRVYTEFPAPVVVDADALFAMAESGKAACASPRILTPHPGEFARLTKRPVEDGPRANAAVQFAREWAADGDRVILVLKGHRTVVTDGRRVSVNQTGNPGMATGGAGDVLTGLITALLCQRLDPFDAARLAVHVHGLAGDLAASSLGELSLIASDIVDFLPAAFCSLDKNAASE